MKKHRFGENSCNTHDIFPIVKEYLQIAEKKTNLG